MINKFLWVFITCIAYLSLAAGLWITGGNTRSDVWYLIVSLPVFLFSGIFYLWAKKALYDLHEGRSEDEKLEK